MMLFVLIGLTAWMLLAVGAQSAALASQPYAAAGTGTLLDVSREKAPLPQATTEAPPPAEGTQPAAVPTGGAAEVGGETGTAGTTAPSGGDFPWLIVLVLGLLALAGLGYAATRQRGPARATTSPASRQRTTTSQTQQRPAPQSRAPAGAARPPAQEAAPATRATMAVMSAAPEAQTAATGAAGTVECPNCGATNSTSESFCSECGQDLRQVPRSAHGQRDAAPSQASIPATLEPTSAAEVVPSAEAAPVLPDGIQAPAETMADATPEVAVASTMTTPFAAEPPVEDVVDEYTPYLETLDRVDEQLEFVLSRQRVVIGTAPGNDIVIDTAFRGWQTVSPVHAELRNDQEGFVVIDRESEYGTFVNDLRTGENILADGDTLRLGDVSFVFHVPVRDV